jgi:hypothetical protein
MEIMYGKLYTLDNGDGTWTLTKPFKVRVEGDNHTATFVVAAGTLTDYATVPWFMRIFMSRTGRHGKPAVWHDELYRKLINGTNSITRREADVFFRIGMKSRGVNFFLRWGAYFGVRLFGWMYAKPKQ